MPLDPELLRIEFLGVTLRHDEVDLPREDLAIFFADVGARYGLTRLEFHAEPGATFSGPDGAECALRPAQIASCGVTGMGYREGVERVAGMVGEATERYGIGEMWIEDVTLVAVWDVQDPDEARELLVDNILQLDDDRLELLEGDEVSLGLRIWRRAGEASFECAVEPMHAEPSKVYLRLVQTQGEAIADAAGLREAIDAVHGFLTGPLTAFMMARARR